MGKNKKYKCNGSFEDNILSDALTYSDYLYRIKKICVSMFEWVNLPNSMDSRYLEFALYYDGMATILDTKEYGLINTRCASGGDLNIYGIPTSFNCYSYNFQEVRRLYSGLNDKSDKEECVLVMNNYDRVPTRSTIELFAQRLAEAERTCDTNVIAQQTPYFIVGTEKQRTTLENLWLKVRRHCPVIFGDKDNISLDSIKCINTKTDFIAKDIMIYKKQIMNELLTFLGINNVNTEKKDRLVVDEANADNEVINFNLQSFLAPRQEACKQLNELFGLTGTDKEISVRVRSDLQNIIKKELSVVNDYVDDKIDTKINKEVGDLDE